MQNKLKRILELQKELGEITYTLQPFLKNYAASKNSNLTFVYNIFVYPGSVAFDAGGTGGQDRDDKHFTVPWKFFDNLQEYIKEEK